MRMATEKQIGYIKRLVDKTKFNEPIDYDNLSSKEASQLIDRIHGKKGNDSKSGTSSKGGASDNDYLGVAHGMVFKILLSRLAVEGKIPPRGEEAFLKNVEHTVGLYFKSLNRVKANFQKVNK